MFPSKFSVNPTLSLYGKGLDWLLFALGFGRLA